MNVAIPCTKLTVPLLAKLNQLKNANKYEFSIVCYGTDTLCPFDAWVSIVDTSLGGETKECLVIEGYATGDELGYCKVVLPLKDAYDYAIGIECFSVDDLPDWVKELSEKQE